MPCPTEQDCQILDALASVAWDNLVSAEAARDAAQQSYDNAYAAWYLAVYEAMLCWQEYFDCISGQMTPQAGMPLETMSFKGAPQPDFERQIQMAKAYEATHPVIAEGLRLVVVRNLQLKAKKGSK